MSEEKSSPNREIITINIGGCGVNLGQTLNEQYCVEHGISCNGDKKYKTHYDGTIPITFEETSKGKYIARSLMIDLDQYSICNIQNIYKYNKLFLPDYLISGKYDACNNFAMGHYSTGKQLIDKVNNAIRMAMERCNSPQGFIINHSFSGGTGSGLGALILERLAVDYRKKPKIGFEVLDNLDGNKASNPAATFNSILLLHWLLDHTEISFILDNHAIHRKCQNILNIKAPRYQNYNYLLNKLISSITAPSRYRLNENLLSMTRDFTPFPRLHFLNSSMCPIIPNDNNTDNNDKTSVILDDDIRSLTNECTKQKNFFIHCADFDCEEDQYMAISFNYRGKNINEHVLEASNAMSWLRENKSFVPCRWAADAPTIKFIDGKIHELGLDDMMNTDKHVTMIANNTFISRCFKQRFAKHFDLLYGQRSYVHWYVGEGMQEGEFAEAREDLGFLEKDYLDVLAEQATDEEEEEEEEDGY